MLALEVPEAVDAHRGALGEFRYFGIASATFFLGRKEKQG